MVRGPGNQGSVQQHVAQVIGGIAAVGLHAADDKVVPLGEACVLFAVILAGGAVELHVLQPHAAQQLHRLFPGDAACL